MSRFDYIRYDAVRAETQADFKDTFLHVEKLIETNVKSKRAQKLALTALEVCYMWIGKGLRDDQIEANGSAELEEERTDG